MVFRKFDDVITNKELIDRSELLLNQGHKPNNIDCNAKSIESWKNVRRPRLASQLRRVWCGFIGTVYLDQLQKKTVDSS